ncbi:MULTISPECIES: hypothetical protein [unclassified Bacillus cereus group]|uniref:hypothetical protein n=1 Tax=unclassified Bacillus cereus group TaxID=2750818 RepID=UPI001F59D89C|nr:MULTISPECIES: hypothetical protein [unclassified Bacillus cereus group]
MNKYLVGIGIACLLLSTGCSSSKENMVKQEINKQEDREVKEIIFPKGVKETGEASMQLITNGEQQGENQIPILKVDPKLNLAQIQLELKGLNENETAYIYVDKKFITKEEVTKVFSTFVNLEGELLKVGEHTVSIVQFKDEKSKKEIRNYKEVKFKIEQGAVESR